MDHASEANIARRWFLLAERIIEAIEEAGHRFSDRPSALSIVNQQIELALKRRSVEAAGSDKDYENSIDFGRNDSEFIFRADDAVSLHLQPHHLEMSTARSGM